MILRFIFSWEIGPAKNNWKTMIFPKEWKVLFCFGDVILS